MGGGNGQKAKMAREKNNEKNKAPKGSQLETNKKAMSIQMGCHIRMKSGVNQQPPLSWTQQELDCC
jgi:hypothetical protein